MWLFIQKLFNSTSQWFLLFFSILQNEILRIFLKFSFSERVTSQRQTLSEVGKSVNCKTSVSHFPCETAAEAENLSQEAVTIFSQFFMFISVLLLQDGCYYSYFIDTLKIL